MLELCFRQKLGSFQLNIDVEVPAAGVTAVFGVSGAGKTSFLSVISGLSCPDQGYVKLNNNVFVDVERNIFLQPQQRFIGYVFQDIRLFPHYTVKGNLRYGMTKQMKSQFDDIVTLLGIQHLLQRYPVALSGGEKQRVAIGRALLSSPQLLLMDEPLAALDMPRKKELLFYLNELSKKVDIPILYISHHMDEILLLASHLLLLDGGTVLAHGEVEKVWQSGRLQPWLKERAPSVIYKVELLRHHLQHSLSAVAFPPTELWLEYVPNEIGSFCRIQIFADNVTLSMQLPSSTSTVNILPVTVEMVYPLPDQCRVDVKLRFHHFILWSRTTVLACEELQLRPGLNLYAWIHHIVVF